MKNLIKLPQLLILCLVICFLSSCGGVGDKYHNIEVVNRETGEIYTLIHNSGDGYFVRAKTITTPIIDSSYCR